MTPFDATRPTLPNIALKDLSYFVSNIQQDRPIGQKSQSLYTPHHACNARVGVTPSEFCKDVYYLEN